MSYIRHTLFKPVHPTFWVKTFLHQFVPGGFGYIRKLRRFHDPAYDHDRDKHEIHKKHNPSEGWKASADGDLLMRDYASYEEYVTHQKLKLDELLKKHGGFDNSTITQFRFKFFLRFKDLHELLPKDATILCCGARQGTEVEVLRDLGFKNAYGIDLNPGPENPYVKPGDFMNLDLPDNSVDLLYTNCVDHAFDLEKMINEHARVLKPGGFLLYEMGANAGKGKGGAFEAVTWDRTEDIVIRLLNRFNKLIRAESDESFGGVWFWVMVQGKR
jgi:SAM-dependent methyltransferase